MHGTSQKVFQPTAMFPWCRAPCFPKSVSPLTEMRGAQDCVHVCAPARTCAHMHGCRHASNRSVSTTMMWPSVDPFHECLGAMGYTERPRGFHRCLKDIWRHLIETILLWLPLGSVVAPRHSPSACSGTQTSAALADMEQQLQAAKEQVTRHGPYVTSHGPWLIGICHGSQGMGHKSYGTGHKAWSRGHKAWVMGHKAHAIGHKAHAIGHKAYAMGSQGICHRP